MHKKYYTRLDKELKNAIVNSEVFSTRKRFWIILIFIFICYLAETALGISIGITPGRSQHSLIQDPCGSGPLTISVGYGLIYQAGPDEPNITHFSIADGNSLGVETCVGYAHSGIKSFDIVWTNGEPNYPYNPVAYIHLPENWAESKLPGTYEILVSHASEPTGGGIGVGIVVQSQIWLNVYSGPYAPILEIIASTTTPMVGEQVRIEAIAYDPQTPEPSYRDEVVWIPGAGDAIIEQSFSSDHITAWHENHQGVWIWDEAKYGTPYPYPEPSGVYKIDASSPTGAVLDYQWDFDTDGNWDTDWHKTFVSDIMLVDFNKPGTFELTVQAWSPKRPTDLVSTDSIIFTVVPRPCSETEYPGDQNHDCYVNLLDYASLASSWLEIGDLEPNVSQQWIRKHNGSANNTDYARDIDVDSLGNVYVTGETRMAGPHTSDYDYTTIKYDRDGSELWVASYNFSPGPYKTSFYDYPRVIAIDNLGNVFVTGLTWGTGYDYGTVKYGPNGSQLWVARYNGPGSGNDEPDSIAVNADGSICITGKSMGLEGNYDYATIKYDMNGNELWVARYNGPGSGNDEPDSIAVNADGSICITGKSMGLEGNYDYATIKYDTNGNELWVARYNGGGSENNYAYHVNTDNLGNVYVTGSTGGSHTLEDYITVKYDPNGNELLAAKYKGPKNDYDYTRAIEADSSGNIYITGYIWGGPSTTFDYATLKYSPVYDCMSKLAGDINHDCKVDFKDLAIIVSHWLESFIP